MENGFESIPDEPPREVEEAVELQNGEREKLAELTVMLKAQNLFSQPRLEDDPHRSPDDVTEFELVAEVFSFLRDKDGEEKRDRRTLTYRRLFDDEGELIKETQVIEYRESDSSIEALITCDRFPDAEVSVVILKKIEDFLDYHSELAALRAYPRSLHSD
jgi:hypothetical protein